MTHRTLHRVEDEPITLAEARLQLKVDDDDTTHDAVIEALITTVREYAEHATGRAFAIRTVEASLDAFPAEDFIDLPMPPVVEVIAITYVDAQGAEQEMAASDYALSEYGECRRINLAYGKSWPSTRAQPNAVRIEYDCGYDDCPKAAKAAMLIHLELESPLSALTPAERESKERARDALLQTLRIYGR